MSGKEEEEGGEGEGKGRRGTMKDFALIPSRTDFYPSSLPLDTDPSKLPRLNFLNPFVCVFPNPNIPWRPGRDVFAM